MKNEFSLPKTIDTGVWDNTGHIQGIALDLKKGFVYYSYTTVFVKADLDGNVIGTVKGLTGHLGCIAFNEDDGLVYGSNEYKHDSIGKGIMRTSGVTLADEDAFYITIFDVDKIDRLDMDAEKDGIMTAVYLPEVVEDYSATNPDGTQHRYGCSGVDGTTIGPIPGSGKDGKRVLLIAYGIYNAGERTDSDNQVILQFDPEKLRAAARPLSQLEPHHFGLTSEARYFLHTGNTNWGIQNLEYDAFTGDYFLAVYRGVKLCYPNFPMYVIDGKKAPEYGELYGRDGEMGYKLSLKETSERHESGICGLSFPYGQTGIFSVGDGRFYFSHDKKIRKADGNKQFSSVITLYELDGETFKEAK